MIEKMEEFEMLVSFKAIGSNIRAARKAQGLTQEQAAELLKMSQLHFGRLERGERPAALEQLAQIARVLHVSMPTLLRGSIDEGSFDFSPSDEALELGQAIARQATGCSPKSCQLMLTLCRAVAQSDKQMDE